MTDKQISSAPEQKAAKPEWLSKKEEKMSDPDKQLWDSAYAKVHDQNHYMKGEGPQPALARLKKQGFLTDLSVDDIAAESQKKVKAELGKDGSLHRKFYTGKDQVLTGDQEQKEVSDLVERTKKADLAQKRTPTPDQIKGALTPEVQKELADANIKIDPDKFGAKLTETMKNDKTLSSAMMEKMTTVPAGSPYVAAGVVRPEQIDALIKQQKELRKDLQKSDPEFGKKMDQSDLGYLLYKQAKEHPDAKDPMHIDYKKLRAVDDLTANLQDIQDPSKHNRQNREKVRKLYPDVYGS